MTIGALSLFAHPRLPRQNQRRIHRARSRADAKANGVKFGRKHSLPYQQQEAPNRIDAGETQEVHRWYLSRKALYCVLQLGHIAFTAPITPCTIRTYLPPVIQF